MVWDVAVERLENNPLDESRIDGGLHVAETALKALAALKRPGDWLLGEQVTLADLHLAPVIGYFLKTEEGRGLLKAFPSIEDWWGKISARPSFATTEKAS
jgi:glutathione S-transferase